MMLCRPGELRMCSITYSSCGCIWDFFSTSRQMSEKKQGKRQWKKQRHAIGQTGTATSRHTALRLAKGESATITQHYELSRRLTAPILLPHPTTLRPRPLRNLTATSTSAASCLPREIQSLPVLSPQPSKSKQASPTWSGRLGRWVKPSQRLELLPWRQRTTYLVCLGEQRERAKGMQKTECLKRLPCFLRGLRMSSLQRNRGGRIRAWLHRSMQFLAGYRLISTDRTLATPSASAYPIIIKLKFHPRLPALPCHAPAPRQKQ